MLEATGGTERVALEIAKIQVRRGYDVTIASISVTTDRAKTIMYCNPNGALSIVIFGPKAVAIKTPADLVGKRIGINEPWIDRPPHSAPRRRCRGAPTGARGRRSRLRR